jgi:cysteine desulfurase/selenocysteine lyase
MGWSRSRYPWSKTYYFLGESTRAEPEARAERPLSAPSAFDPDLVRADFPALAERVHGRPLVWLDNGATTQKPEAVIERLSAFYRHENSNVHRAAHMSAPATRS